MVLMVQDFWVHSRLESIRGRGRMDLTSDWCSDETMRHKQLIKS